MNVAVIGASGFIGSRLVETWQASGWARVRPVVHSYRRLARVARFDLDWRLADARDPTALTEALRGCELAVDTVVGDARVIQRCAEALLPSAQAAGVRRVVYLSSASVHGQRPPQGTDETSPLNERQSFVYNRAKIAAERALRSKRARSRCELVVLRPGIVFGPRDRWAATLAAELHGQRAWLVNEGRGICNSLYVDNLVHAIERSLTVAAADGEVFLVRDRETVTWADFYGAVAATLGADTKTIHQLSTSESPASLRERADAFRSHPGTQAVLRLLPTKLKCAVRAAIAACSQPAPESPWLPDGSSTAPTMPSREMAALQSCAWPIPIGKAQRILGYNPSVSFADGVQRTAAWLTFTGWNGRLAP